MPIQKQPLNVNFSNGLDLKSDPFQISPGKFLTLQNSVFNVGGQLSKRNGFGSLNTPLDTTANTIGTFKNNLLTLGKELDVYSQEIQSWSKAGGNFFQASLSVASAYRSSTSQTAVDMAVASNGLMCVVFTDNIPTYSSGQPTGTTKRFSYAVIDGSTDQILVSSELIPGLAITTESPRVFTLGQYFIIVMSSASPTTILWYTAINWVTSPTAALSFPTTIATNYLKSSVTLNFDGVVAGSKLYLAWNGTDGGGAIHAISLDTTLTLSSPVTFAGSSCTEIGVGADTSGGTPVIWIAFHNAGDNFAHAIALSNVLATVLGVTRVPTTGTNFSDTSISNITVCATGGIATILFEFAVTYSYNSSIANHYIGSASINTSGTNKFNNRIVHLGLASKAFIYNSIPYVLMAYSHLTSGIENSTEPTFFLAAITGISVSIATEAVNIVSKLAFGNAGGYLTDGLPNVFLSGNSAQIPYLYKDLLEALNKTATGSTGGIYTQTGINIATFGLLVPNLQTIEAANNLTIAGGFPWMFDGTNLVEQDFFVYPENILLTTGGVGGHMTDGIYYYSVCYEWTDAQGNLYRSAPSIPVSATLSGGTNTQVIGLAIPTIDFTYKNISINSPNISVVIYRYSVAQPIYYQVTSIQQPLQNAPLSSPFDSVNYTDIAVDSSILGNNILYTNGGVVEDIQAPGWQIGTLYKSRMFVVDSEDQNLIWFSKQIIEATPIEMSDLFTIYVSPNITGQGSSGPITALGAMDDKLIIFFKNAIYYITGSGPDNTGANNDFSDPIFITSTVGCTNLNSIVFMPHGLMFQSDKGIWLLGRDLSTNYIGAPVEQFNSLTVRDALNIPGTNQVRFTMSDGVTFLLYDYFYGQWGTFVSNNAVSSTIYQNLQTFVSNVSTVFQENPGFYQDGTTPVLMSFTTGWFNLAGLQGFERIYYFYLLGKYLSSHTLQIQVAYDYNPTIVQTSIITPDSSNSIEQWRVFMAQQKCEAFQLTISEVSAVAGAGLTLSGLDLTLGMKSSYPRIKAAASVG